MSTRDWPSEWGPHHEAICTISAIRTRLTVKNGERVVELHQAVKNPSGMKLMCLGTVPIDIDHKTLTLLVVSKIESHALGFKAGQLELAQAIQAPIAHVLDQIKIG